MGAVLAAQVLVPVRAENSDVSSSGAFVGTCQAREAGLSMHEHSWSLSHARHRPVKDRHEAVVLNL